MLPSERLRHLAEADIRDQYQRDAITFLAAIHRLEVLGVDPRAAENLVTLWNFEVTDRRAYRSMVQP